MAESQSVLSQWYYGGELPYIRNQKNIILIFFIDWHCTHNFLPQSIATFMQNVMSS